MSKITRRDFLRCSCSAAASFLLGERKVNAETAIAVNTPVMSTGAWDKAVIVVSADDGFLSVYNEVYPIMFLENGLLFTIYAPTGSKYIQDPENGYNDGVHISWKQLWEMYWNGVEIGNHGNKHLNFTGMTYSDIITDIKNAQTKLKNHGLINVTSFAYPFGVKTLNVVLALQAIGMTSGRGSYDKNDQFNQPATFNQWWIESLSFRCLTKTSTFEQMRPYIDEAVTNKLALSIVLHDVFPGATGPYQLDSAELEKTAAYLAELRSAGLIEVETVTRAVSKLLHYKNLP